MEAPPLSLADQEASSQPESHLPLTGVAYFHFPIGETEAHRVEVASRNSFVELRCHGTRVTSPRACSNLEAEFVIFPPAQKEFPLLWAPCNHSVKTQPLRRTSRCSGIFQLLQPLSAFPVCSSSTGHHFWPPNVT